MKYAVITYNFNNYEIMRDIPDCALDPDIEYLYIIDIKDDIPSLVAYSRISDEAWENGPSDYLNSWNFVELINTSDYVTEG